jgi:hypothetical protein
MSYPGRAKFIRIVGDELKVFVDEGDRRILPQVVGLEGICKMIEFYAGLNDSSEFSVWITVTASKDDDPFLDTSTY